MIKWIKERWEVLSYLFFGVMTTLLNIVLYALFNKLFGYEAANSWGNVLDNFLCILFAYATNRTFVFASKTKGKEAFAEFGKFFVCRLGTMILDAVIMVVGGNLLAAQGAALMDGLLQSIGNTLLTGGSATSVVVIGGPDGPTTTYLAGTTTQGLWGLGVKFVSNVAVIVLNYLFSKVFVFTRKKDD